VNSYEQFVLPRLVCVAFAICAGAIICRQSFAQTNAPAECLVPAGSVPLDGVEGRHDHMAADPATKRLFLSGLENHTVEVIDLAKRQRIHEIPLVREPQGLAFIPGISRLLVCSRGDGTCRSFDADTYDTQSGRMLAQTACVGVCSMTPTLAAFTPLAAKVSWMCFRFLKQGTI
jgi:DNA-binding beta-propeller fold protein YncE